MSEYEMLDKLIAFCQREGVLSSGEDVYDELANIFDCDASEVEDLLF